MIQLLAHAAINVVLDFDQCEIIAAWIVIPLYGCDYVYNDNFRSS
jgi:hypothetical protein